MKMAEFQLHADRVHVGGYRRPNIGTMTTTRDVWLVLVEFISANGHGRCDNHSPTRAPAQSEGQQKPQEISADKIASWQSV